MSKSSELEEMLRPLIEKEGYECVDVTFEKVGQDWVLTAYIDKPGGITIEDCEAVNNVLSPFLDETDPIEQSYLLEVSSPGIDRPFKKLEDYKKNIGNKIEVNLFKKIDKSKHFEGILKDVTEEEITLETEAGDKVFEMKDISKAHPYVEI